MGPADYSQLTNDQLREELDRREIEHTTRLTKDELVELLVEDDAKPPADGDGDDLTPPDPDDVDGPDVDDNGDEAETEPDDVASTQQIIIGATGQEVITDTGIDYAGEGLIGPKDNPPTLYPGDVVGTVTLPVGHDDAAASALEQRAAAYADLPGFDVT